MIKNIIVFGYGVDGVQAYLKLEQEGIYNLLGFADNSLAKQGRIAFEKPVKSLDDLEILNQQVSFSVVIASSKWMTIKEQLEERQIEIYGIIINSKLQKYNEVACFDKLDCSKPVFLYAGDIVDNIHMANDNLFGLSITKMDEKHIFHDIRWRYPLPDESIYAYQAEDVLEHIEIGEVVPALNEIYRILKKGSVLRICLPDYNSPYLSRISLKDDTGKILYDPTGGGELGLFGIGNGGHLWFPTYHLVRGLLEKSSFKEVDFICYYTVKGELVKNKFDYLNGYVNRVSDIEDDREIYSIIVDCKK